jgi:hypothetical protein
MRDYLYEETKKLPSCPVTVYTSGSIMEEIKLNFHAQTLTVQAL